MDGRRCFIRMGGRTTLFYKDGWMDGRRCFIRMVVLWDGRTTLFYKDGRTTLFYKDGGWTDDVVL